MQDKRWIAKSWPLPLIALIPLIAFIAPILYKGWRLSAIRQLIQAENTLPELDLVAFFKHGLILWAITFVYWLVPVLLCSVLGFGILGLVQDAGNIGGQSAQDWAAQQAREVVWAALIYLTWAIITVPVYQAGLIRCALSGSWRSMLNIPANVTLFLRHLPEFLMFFLGWLVIAACITIVGIFLTISVAGIALLPVFALTAYYVTTAKELGHLAKKISATDSGVPRISTPVSS